MALRLPDALPRTIGALAALPFVAYGLTELATGAHLSTLPLDHGTGYLVVLGFGVVVAFLGALIGRLIRGLFADAAPVVISTRAAFATLLIATVGASAWGYAGARADAGPQQPAVLLDRHRLDTVVAVDSTRPLVTAQALLTGTSADDTMLWRGRVTRFRAEPNALLVDDVIGGRRVVIDLPGLREIVRVDAVPVRQAADQPENLAVMVVGDTAGHRAMFAVLDPEFRLLRQERLVRDWDLSETSLMVRRDDKHGRDQLLVMPGRPTQRLYAIRP